MKKKITGETELIQTYLAPLAKDNLGAVKLLDDCALFQPTPGTDLIISTDAIAEGVHFFSEDDPEDIAWKALAVSVSDLAAKAAKPRIYQMALSFPEAPTHKFMRAFAKGLRDAQSTFGIQISGGDTDRRPGPLSITITVVGEVSQKGMVSRTTAKSDEILFVSGTLGEAALGLKVRRQDRDTRNWKLNKKDTSELLRRYFRPTPRLDLRQILEHYASSAIDLSDGFYKDLQTLCSASKCGAEIDIFSLPFSSIVHKILSVDAKVLNVILGGGEDYEVLFTVPQTKSEYVIKRSKQSGINVTRIGRLTTKPNVKLLDARGRALKVSCSGWDHFSN